MRCEVRDPRNSWIPLVPGHPCLGWRGIRRTPPTRESARAKRCHPVPQRGPALPLLGDDPSRSKGRARVSVATCPVEHERVGRGRGHHLPNMRWPPPAGAGEGLAASGWVTGGAEPRARKFGPAQGHQGTGRIWLVPALRCPERSCYATSNMAHTDLPAAPVVTPQSRLNSPTMAIPRPLVSSSRAVTAKGPSWDPSETSSLTA